MGWRRPCEVGADSLWPGVFDGFAVSAGLYPFTGSAIPLVLLALIGISQSDRAHAFDCASNQIPRFSISGLQQWKPRKLGAEVDWHLGHLDGRPALIAETDKAASGYLHANEIDLTRFPRLRWSWRVDRPLSSRSETEKSGDDYAAAVYLIQSYGPMFWQKRSLAYVWSSRHSRGTHWPNAWAPRQVRMLALQDRASAVGVWVTERRSVQQDFREVFGKSINRVHAVAVMSDSDNGGGQGKAAFGDFCWLRPSPDRPASAAPPPIPHR